MFVPQDDLDRSISAPLASWALDRAGTIGVPGNTPILLRKLLSRENLQTGTNPQADY